MIEGLLPDRFHVRIAEAQAILNPFTSDICEALDIAFAELHQAPVLRPTAEANFISSRWYHILNELLLGRSDVLFDTLQGQDYICFADRLIIRLKRMDRGLATKNIRTAQQIAWSRQQGLQGLPPIPRLVCGYLYDQFAMRPLAVYIALPTGLSDPLYEWVWRIRGPDGDESLMLPLPLPPGGDDPAEEDRITA